MSSAAISKVNIDQELQLVHESFQDILRHRQYVLGPEVEALEEKLASWLGRTFAIGCNSGFGAYLVSLLALGIGHGKRVVVPAFGPAPYLGSLIRRGAHPVLVDVSPDDFHISPSAVAEALKDPADLIVVHQLFGGFADMDGINAVAANIPIVEVLTYSLGAQVGRKQAGTSGLLATSCFREESTIAAYGDAGMVWTDDVRLDDRLRRIRQEDNLGCMHADYVSGNFQQDTLQAAILLRKFPEWLIACEDRVHAAQYLTGALAATGLNEITVPVFYQTNATHFVIFAERRDELISHLHSKGIAATTWWPTPIWQQPGFQSLGCKRGHFPNAERAAAMSIQLPLNAQQLSENDRIAAEFFSFFR
jgi:dTDP-4-amino-4,6-dideoxygalactose transaminase